MTEKVHSVLRAQSQLRLLPELGQNLRPNYLYVLVFVVCFVVVLFFLFCILS